MLEELVVLIINQLSAQISRYRAAIHLLHSVGDRNSLFHRIPALHHPKLGAIIRPQIC